MKSIVQIELTNFCNRHCNYCGNRLMTRPKGYADDRLIDRCIEILLQLGQFKSVGLNHYGESTLHPKLVEYIARFNEAGITPFLFTNGDFLTDELIDKLATVKLDPLVISAHLPREKRIELWRKCKDRMIAYWQLDFDEENIINLAGQIGPEYARPSTTFLTDPATQCHFLSQQRGIVLWNGDVTVCCPDFDGFGVYASIFDEDILEKNPKPFGLCAKCPGHPGNFTL